MLSPAPVAPPLLLVSSADQRLRCREQEPAWLQRRPPHSTGAELSVARFEIELSKEDRYSEDLKLERERLKARCEELMGEQQARLLAR